MIKKQRQEYIIEIISNNSISTQEMLKDYLEKSGIIVTQATLSRDINELNLKKNSNGIYKYIVPLKNKMECPSILKDSVTDVLYSMNMVVIKCHTGMAQAACATLDKMQCSEIVGTIAGDDTIFAVMNSENDAADFSGSLKALICGAE